MNVVIDRKRADRRVDQRINHGADVKQEQADSVKYSVRDDIDLADADIFLPFVKSSAIISVPPSDAPIRSAVPMPKPHIRAPITVLPRNVIM